MDKFILGIDQSTQGTKALLFDSNGKIAVKSYLPHKQIIDENGFVSHDLEEIYTHVIAASKEVITKANIQKEQVVGIGISNQRETCAIWDGATGNPLNFAVVWQCGRAKGICELSEIAEKKVFIKRRTGLTLSPFFPAAKWKWLLDNTNIPSGIELCLGTIDTWLVYKLSGDVVYKTDYSNASRTQLFDIHTLTWSKEICALFGIDSRRLAEVCDSDSLFAETDLDGFLPKPIPIHAVLGDSHAALYAQGCTEKGSIKATYGTGSSVMLNIGNSPANIKNELSTSLAWKLGGKVSYALEGNINYAGAVLSWLINDIGINITPQESEQLALEAAQDDELYFVPAFSGLGAPYFDNGAKALITGMTRKTTKRELIRAALDCVAYQVADIIELMREGNIGISELKIDGAPSGNKYLCQFQSDILQTPVKSAVASELSTAGAAYAAGIAMGLYNKNMVKNNEYREYFSIMSAAKQHRKYCNWKQAVSKATSLGSVRGTSNKKN